MRPFLTWEEASLPGRIGWGSGIRFDIRVISYVFSNLGGRAGEGNTLMMMCYPLCLSRTWEERWRKRIQFYRTMNDKGALVREDALTETSYNKNLNSWNRNRNADWKRNIWAHWYGSTAG